MSSPPPPERPSPVSATLTLRERLTLAHAVALIAIINLAVRVLPFRRVATLLIRGTLRPGTPCAPDRLAAIVGRASAHCWPAPSCLTRSLVLCRMLVRRGIGAQLVLGVETRDGRLRAHAWVEHGGRTLHHDASGFTTLCRIDHRGVVTADSP